MRPLIEGCLAKFGRPETFADVRSWVETGESRLLVGPSCVAVTEEVKDYHVWLGAGDLPGLQELEAQAAEQARAAGCHRMTIEGRPGWERALKGYRTMLVRDL